MKKLIALLLAAVFAVSLTGCFNATDYLASITYTEAPVVDASPVPTQSGSDTDTSRQDDRRSTPVPELTPEPTEPVQSGDELPEGVRKDISERAKESVIKAKGIMDEVIGYITANPINGSANTRPFVGANKYRALSHDELLLYENLLLSAQNFEEYIFTCESYQIVTKVLDALYTDHPETELYFTVTRTEQQNMRGGSGRTSSSGSGSGNGRTDGSASGDKTSETAEYHSVFFLPDARYFEATEDIGAIKEQLEAFEVVSEYVASRIPESFSAIDKYRALAYYISINTDYIHIENEETPRFAANAFGAIITGDSICQGFTIGYEYLCRAADLYCHRVRNDRNDSGMHFWDIVFIKEGYYYVDVTWSDGTVENYTDSAWFRWFMFTADDNHTANDGTVTTGAELDKRNWR